jgi:hypothetical protein
VQAGKRRGATERQCSIGMNAASFEAPSFAA